MRKLLLKTVPAEPGNIEGFDSVQQTVEVPDGKRLILFSLKSDDVSVYEASKIRKQIQDRLGSDTFAMLCVVGTEDAIEIYEVE